MYLGSDERATDASAAAHESSTLIRFHSRQAAPYFHVDPAFVNLDSCCVKGDGEPYPLKDASILRLVLEHWSERFAANGGKTGGPWGLPSFAVLLTSVGGDLHACRPRR
jgi:hypothetical protein